MRMLHRMTGEVLESSPNDRFSDRQNFWLQRIASAESVQRDNEGRSAVDELNQLWEEMGNLGAEFLVSGNGVWTEATRVDERSDPDTELVVETVPGQYTYHDKAGKITGQTLYSEGFSFTALFDHDEPRLWYRFLAHQYVEKASLTHTTVHQLGVFVEAGSCSYTPVSDFEQLLSPFQQSEDTTTVHEIINKASDNFVALITSREFTFMDRALQASMIDQIIELAEQKSGIRECPVMLDAQYAYVPKTEPGSDICYEDTTQGIQGMTIGGIVLALTMLGRERLNEQPIKKIEDMVEGNQYNGLCLTLLLDQVSDNRLAEEGVRPGAVIHVPISGQDMEVIIG